MTLKRLAEELLPVVILAAVCAVVATCCLYVLVTIWRGL